MKLIEGAPAAPSLGEIVIARHEAYLNSLLAATVSYVAANAQIPFQFRGNTNCIEQDPAVLAAKELYEEADKAAREDEPVIFK